MLMDWQIPMQCAKCKDVIFSRYRGEFRRCECGAIAVDQTPHYGRYMGNPTDFIEVNNNDNNSSQ